MKVTVTQEDPIEGKYVHEFPSREAAAEHFMSLPLRELIKNIQLTQIQLTTNEPAVITIEVVD